MPNPGYGLSFRRYTQFPLLSYNCHLSQQNNRGVLGCSVFDYDEEVDYRFKFNLSAESDGLLRLISIIQFGKTIPSGGSATIRSGGVPMVK